MFVDELFSSVYYPLDRVGRDRPTGMLKDITLLDVAMCQAVQQPVAHDLSIAFRVIPYNPILYDTVKLNVADHSWQSAHDNTFFLPFTGFQEKCTMSMSHGR